MTDNLKTTSKKVLIQSVNRTDLFVIAKEKIIEEEDEGFTVIGSFDEIVDKFKIKFKKPVFRLKCSQYITMNSIDDFLTTEERTFIVTYL
jgi:hypothetical protein